MFNSTLLNIWLRYSLLLLSFLFSACSIYTSKKSFTPSTETETWKQHVESVTQLVRYQARGAFAYITGKNNVYARFFWQQYSPEHYQLLLTNPFGGTELKLNVTPRIIQLTNNQGKTYSSTDISKTLKQITGMELPLNNIRLWLVGLPGDTKLFQLKNNLLQQAFLTTQDKKNWHVTYQHYNTNVIPALPDQLELSTDNVRIKLKVDNWNLQ